MFCRWPTSNGIRSTDAWLIDVSFGKVRRRWPTGSPGTSTNSPRSTTAYSSHTPSSSEALVSWIFLYFYLAFWWFVLDDVYSVLLYGVEITWHHTEHKQTKKLEAFEMWVYRHILRISWRYRVTNVGNLSKRWNLFITFSVVRCTWATSWEITSINYSSLSSRPKSTENELSVEDGIHG